MRITQKILENKVKYLNELTNSPTEQYTRGDDGKLSANIGNFHIDYAYGGCKLVRTMNEGGGETNITQGFDTKRDLAEKIDAVATGFRLA